MAKLPEAPIDLQEPEQEDASVTTLRQIRKLSGMSTKLLYMFSGVGKIKIIPGKSGAETFKC